ncbi:TonB-dependent receptor [Zhongshania guokunii]|uniref:TonB-dependent receptor n=1 Tax=Zhongshania guokunii TaxID=641783 RepID=A0ABV3U876_9GAMM
MITAFKRPSRFGAIFKTSARILVVSSPFLAISAQAQDDAPATKKRSNRLLEEVVVTAQKREENSQDVPITMAAIGGEKLEAFGIEDTADLQKITPGLTFTEQYGYTLIYLRGVGSEAFLPNAEPSVATYIDNINIAGSHGKQDAIGPVERIEVLKGPQGTLFGRSATGGAISIISKTLPTEGYTAELTYNKGNYEAEHILFYADAALTEDFAASISYYDDEREPYGKNTLFGVETEALNDYSKSIRVKLRYFLGDSITLTGIYQESEQVIAESLRNENIRPLGLALGSAPDEPDRISKNNVTGFVSSESDLLGFIAEWAAGPVDLKFVYSDQKSNVQNDLGAHTDYDGTEFERTSFHTYDEPTFQETFELQISSNEDTWHSDKLTWVAGLYHLEAGGGFDRIFFDVSGETAVGSILDAVPDPIANILSPIVGTRVTLESGGNITIESDSVYAQGDYRLTDTVTATVGVRYQEETRGLVRNYLDVVNPMLTRESNPEYFQSDDRSQNISVATFTVPDLSDESVAPRFALQWFASDSVQIFASASRAFKSQTYNILNFFSAPDAVDKSTTTALELGFKSDLFDDTLRFNGAIFQSITENPITSVVSLTSGGVVRFFNAGESKTEGVELEALWQPMPNLNPGLAINSGASYIDAVYTDYKNGSGFDENTGLFYGPGGLTQLPGRDFTGNRVARTPRFSSNVAINQFLQFGAFGDIEIGLDYAYKSDFYLTSSGNPNALQPQYELWGGRISWIYEPLGLTLTGYVSNAKDELYFVQLLENDYGIQANYGSPKLYGAKLKLEF